MLKIFTLLPKSTPLKLFITCSIELLFLFNRHIIVRHSSIVIYSLNSKYNVLGHIT